MPNEKIKSQNYTNFGGINSKASPYVTGPMEFLDMINLDFQTPGSLTHRWGSTQYVGQTFGAPINSLCEFTRLDGSSYVLMSATTGIWSGATTGNSQGLSLSVVGITTATRSKITDITWAANAIIDVAGNNVPYQGNINIQLTGGTAAAGTTIFFDANPFSDNRLSYATINNYLFMADGNKFLKFDGITTTKVGLPPATRLTGSGSADTFGITTLGVGVTGSYAFYASYVNQRGFEGPIWPLGAVNATESAAATLGASFLAITYVMNTPLQYGISSINVYSYWQSATLTANSTLFWNKPYVFLSNYPASGSTQTTMNVGSTAGGQTYLINNVGNFPDTAFQSYVPLGMTLQLFAGDNQVSEIDMANYVPRYLEVYKNQLFSAGFSLTPSTVWFSDIGEPEGYPVDNNFEVRTNDGDYVTALKAYYTRLYIFKKHSFHVLSGDSSANFFLQEVSLAYGCVNHRCAVIYNTTILFLDQKGVIQYNGANLQVISSKVQAIFDSMNYAAALTEATMVHDNIRNQILIGIPVNGSATNNLTVVYDYLVGAWTKYDGFNPSVFASIQGRNTTKNAFYGDYLGRVNWFGSSFLGDNGSGGFSAYFKTRFLHDLGESSQEQYRRLYMDVAAPSSTLTIAINFFQDYGTSIVLGTTMVLGQFQNRIDYGISAKSIAFEMSNIQNSVPLKIHGFTIESRLQRRV